MTLTLDAQQAQNEIQKLRDLSDQLKNSLKDVQERIADKTKWLPNDTEKSLRKQEKSLEKQIKELNKQIKNGEYMLDGVEERLNKMTDYSYNNLKKLENVVKNALKNASFNTDSYREAAQWLQRVNDEMAKRKMDINNQETIDNAKKVLKNPARFSTSEISNAIKTLKELQAITAHNDSAWITLEKSIQRGKEKLDEWNKSAEEAKAKNLQKNLGKLSTDALEEQRKFWQDMVNGANQGSASLSKYQQLLKDVVDEQQSRAKTQAGVVLGDKQNYSVQEIQESIKMTEKLRDAEKYRSSEWITYTEQIKEATEYLKTYDAVAKQTIMESQWKNLATLSAKALEEQKKYWQEMADNEGDPTKFQTYLGYLQSVNKELQRRSEIESEAVLNDKSNYSVQEIQNAIKATEQLREAQKAGSFEWNYFNMQIQQATEYLKKYEDESNRTAMSDQLKNVMNLSAGALEQQQKFWQAEIKSAANNDPMLKTYTANLQAVNKELERRNALQAGQVMNNLRGSSVQEIEDAIKATEKLRDAQKLYTAQWTIYNKQIEKAKKYIQDYHDAVNAINMEKQWYNLKDISAKALEEQKKYWQEVINGAAATDLEMSTYLSKLKAVNDELNRRDAANAQDVMNSIQMRGTKEIEEAIKVMQRLREEQPFNSNEWKQYNAEIERAQSTLKSYQNKLQEASMTQRLSSVTDASKASLEEQRKYWQSMIDGAEQGNQQLPQYIANLQKVNEEEERRVRNNAQDIISRTQQGWDDTIKATEEALNVLKEYRKQLNTNDTAALKDVDDALDILNGKIEQSKEGFMSLTEALDKSSESSMKNFNGTIDELENLKKALEELRKTKVAVNDEKGLADIDKSLERVNDKLAEATGNVRNFDGFINNIKSKNFNELQAAAKQLSEQLKNISASTDEFASKSAQLQQVNARIKEIKKEWEKHDNVIMRTAKRLASYVMVYAGFNEIKSKVSELVRLNLQLSDAMADVQKTTGLAGIELKELGRGIESIDTRTTTNELWGMAAAAGQIGLKTQYDVLGFVKATNMISVSLNELGAEGSATLMKISDLTGDKALYGVEDSLMKIGSAINELTANTAATAGPIADFIGRVGGIASVSSITTDQMAAIGATSDATAQSMEIAGTSMNKLVNALTSNTANIAYAANISRTELEGLISQGKTMEAMLRVFESMEGMGSAQLLSVMKELGSEGARMNQFVTTLVANIDLLKSNLNIASDAFREATSIENEYNVKNESAIGILQRMKNAFVDTFVNSRFVEILKNILITIMDIPRWLEKHRIALTAIKLLIAEIIAFNIPSMFHTLMSNLSGMYKILTGSLSAGIAQFNKAWKAAVISLNNAGVATNGLTGKIRVLWALIKANPLGFFLSAIAAVLAVYDTWFNKIDKISQATAELSEKQSRERMELQAMKNALNDENTSRDTKRKIIRDMNSLYGKYLDFELSEIDVLGKKGAALDYINTKLREQQALEMKNKQQEVIDTEFQAEVRDLIEEMQSRLSDVPEITRKRWAEAFDFINNQIESGVTDGGELIDKLKERFNIQGNILSFGANLKEWLLDTVSQGGIFGVGEAIGLWSLYETFEDKMTSYAKYYTEYKQELLNIETDYQWQMKKLTMQEISDLQNLAKEQEQTILKQSKSTEVVNAMSAIEQRKYYKQILEYRENYQKTLEKLSGNTKGAEQAKWNMQLEANAKQVELYQKLLNPDAYGKSGNITDWTQFSAVIQNLKTASVDSLVSGFKKLQKESAQITSNVDLFNKMFNMNIQPGDFEAMQKQVYDWADQIRDELKRRGIGVTGQFLFGIDGSSREAKRKAREEYQAAMSAFEAYWNERETVLRKKSAEQYDTEAELNRKLELLNEEQWRDEEQLYKMLLNDFYRESTFDPKKYEGPITKIKYFDKKDLKELREQLEHWGIAMEDGMKRKMTEVGVKVQEQAHKVTLEIQKILLEDNFGEQVINQYMESLDRLGLLYNARLEDDNDRSREASQRRLAIMREYADEAYNIDAKSLRDRMDNEELFRNWVVGRKMDEYEALLSMLRKYHDDAEEADRKAAERRKKIFDNSAQGVELSKAQTSVEKNSETEQNKWQRFQELDLVTGDVPRDVEIDLYKQKINLSEQYIKAIQKEMQMEKMKAQLAIESAQSELTARQMMGRDTADAEAELALAKQRYASLERQEILMTKEAREQQTQDIAHLNDLYMQSEQSKLTEIKKYTDAIVDFSSQMGEAAFGEVEDRKEAGRQLIKSLLTTLKDWATVKLTELAMEQMFAAQSTAIEGQETVSDITMQGAQTTASVSMGIASGTAKEVGKLGLGGLAIGALISAALGALLGVAMSALNKSKSTVQSVSGAGGGKLATGMLTYAKGNYPVLGNDGQVYNAQYEGSDMKTGIYGGGAHFGIFSEKKPEAIIDGDTTKKLVTDYRGLWNAILTISRNGRLSSGAGMRTFASGNVEQLAKEAANASGEASAPNETEQMTRATLASLTQVMQRTNAVMEHLAKNGVGVNMYGDKGLYKSSQKGNRFCQRVGL